MRSLPVLFLSALAFGVLIGAATPPQAQMDGPRGKLGIWVGRWNYSGRIYQTPYSDAHSDSGTGVCEWAPGNAYIICDYFSNDPPHDDLSVFSYSPTAKAYTHYTVHQESPPTAEKVTQSGNTWTTLREVPHNGRTLLVRTIFAFLTSDKHTTTVQVSADHARTWTTIIQTTNTKVTGAD
jgi:hypothetical protein